MGKFIDRCTIWFRKIRLDLQRRKGVFEDEVADIRLSNENIKLHGFQNLKKDFFTFTIKGKDDFFKYAFYILMLLLLILLPYASIQTGISEKEISHHEQAERLYNYYAQDDDSLRDDPYMRTHTHIIDFMCYCAGKWFHIADIYILRHIVGAIFAWLIILLVSSFLMNLFAWRAAFFGCVFMALSPPFLGQAFGNLVDIPFTFFYLLALYEIYILIGEMPVIKWKRLGAFIGATVAANAIHIGGFVLVQYLFLFTILGFLVFNPITQIFTRRYIRNFLLLIIILLCVCAVIYLFDPFYPLHHFRFSGVRPGAAIAKANEGLPVIHFLWNKQIVSSHDLSVSFVLQRMQRTLPLLIIIGCLIHFIFIKTIVKNIRITNAILIAITILYPLWCLSKGSCEIYDGWRPYLMLYPFIVIFSVSGYEGILRRIDDKYTNFVVISAVFLLTVMPLRHILFHSNTIGIYYNELSGGISSVFGKYQIDGNESANKMACEWVMEHCKPANDSTKVRVMTDGGKGCDHYFNKDTASFTLSHGSYYQSEPKNWDYFITFPDQVPSIKLRSKNWERMPFYYRYMTERKPVVIIVRNEESPLFAHPITVPTDTLQQTDNLKESAPVVTK